MLIHKNSLKGGTSRVIKHWGLPVGVADHLNNQHDEI